MASLSVPHAYRPAIGSLAELDDEAARKLISAVAELPDYSSVTEIEEAVSDVLPGAAADFVSSLLALRGYLRTKSPDEIGKELSESPDLDLANGEAHSLRERASELLGTAAFNTTSVAVDLQTQHHRNYQSARVFTDVRPIFPDGIEERPTGAVLVEMLQIRTWNRDGDSDTLFIALDERDLTQLRDTVTRALEKTATLRRLLDEQGLAYFTLEAD